MVSLQMALRPPMSSWVAFRATFPADSIDEAGTLYFIDYGNNRIRLIDSDGLVRTVAGNGEVQLLRRRR